jgi:DNA polymerase-4
MAVLRDVSPLVEPLSLDEAFVDLAASPHDLDLSEAGVRTFADELRGRVREVTGGPTASVGAGSSKFIAKIASDLDKPDGLVVVTPGAELELLRPMSVRVIPGVGPQTEERLRRAGIHTVAELELVSLEELIGLLGKAHGAGLFHLARAEDDREVIAERETKSVSVEATYDSDLTDRTLMDSLVTRQAREVGERLQRHGLSGRTVTLKVRLHDFSTLSRSATLPEPTDAPTTISRLARALLTELIESGQTAGGVRLLGVGVSGLADWIQDDLLTYLEESTASESAAPGDEADTDGLPEAFLTEDPVVVPDRSGRRAGAWWPGMDVLHTDLGRGWVWGAGRDIVTVRFETAETPPGPVRSFAAADPALSRWTLERTEADPPV